MTLVKMSVPADSPCNSERLTLSDSVLILACGFPLAFMLIAPDINVLIIREILLEAQVFARTALPGGASPKEVGKYVQHNDYL